jgi:ribonuclease HI
MMLFTDGSVDNVVGRGVGAYLWVNDDELCLTGLETQVKLKNFKDVTSTTLELRILLWALEEYLNNTKDKKSTITVLTDCQNVVGLPARRARLEEKNYLSSKGTKLAQSGLYQQFFEVYDTLNLSLVKVKGHQSIRQKTVIDHVFSLVDKASRNALRASKT